jgi:hypothetical protein
MKKFLGILAIAGVLVACNNSGGDGANGDSTNLNQDSIDNLNSAPANDSLNLGNDSLNLGDTSNRTGSDTSGRR